MISTFSKEELVRRIPIPTKTSTYTPIPHGKLIDIIHQSMSRNNLVVKNSKFWMDKSRNKLIGQYGFNMGDSEIGGQIVFRNSYDKSMSCAIAVGAMVFCCSNGMISGEMTLKRRHTSSADEDVFLFADTSISTYAEVHRQLYEQVLQMKQIILNRQMVSEIIGRMYVLDKVINISQLNTVIKEMDHSTNFKMIGNLTTLWNVYNWVTESFKKSHPNNYIPDHINLHNFMLELIKEKE